MLHEQSASEQLNQKELVLIVCLNYPSNPNSAFALLGLSLRQAIFGLLQNMMRNCGNLGNRSLNHCAKHSLDKNASPERMENLDMGESRNKLRAASRIQKRTRK